MRADNRKKEIEYIGQLCDSELIKINKEIADSLTVKIDVESGIITILRLGQPLELNEGHNIWLEKEDNYLMTEIWIDVEIGGNDYMINLYNHSEVTQPDDYGADFYRVDPELEDEALDLDTAVEIEDIRFSKIG